MPAIDESGLYTREDGQEYIAAFDGIRDWEWVYENLRVKNIGIDDAPSSGAWGFLVECRENDALRTLLYRHALTVVVRQVMREFTRMTQPAPQKTLLTEEAEKIRPDGPVAEMLRKFGTMKEAPYGDTAEDDDETEDT